MEEEKDLLEGIKVREGTEMAESGIPNRWYVTNWGNYRDVLIVEYKVPVYKKEVSIFRLDRWGETLIDGVKTFKEIKKIAVEYVEEGLGELKDFK